MAATSTSSLGIFILCISSAIRLTQQEDVSVETLRINSVITHRFATTRVTSVLANTADSPKEAIFDIRLPKDAFISNFSMIIDGIEYVGEIEEKEAAQRTYDAAVKQGQSAGQVKARDSDKFTTSVNVAAAMNVTFELTYQELLERRLGLYEHVIYIDPGQTVADLQVDVFIVESRIITDLSVPQISNDLLTDVIIDDSNEYAQIDMLSASSAHISFSPTVEEQRHFSSQGVNGQFIVNYDVEHEMDSVGEILVADGYFVHYFAPVWLEPLSKRLIFVLDTSGSMSGTKIRQLKQALVTILDDLNPEDEFGIITFSSNVYQWMSGEILPASYENIQRAKKYADSLRADGGTNINAALLRGIQLLSGDTEKSAMLMFLTDGQATSGVTDDRSILANVRQANHGVSIYSLAFGSGADYNLIQKISAQNNGLARKIYEDADASLQLAGFYDEISSPLLSNLKIKYIGDSIDNSSLTENTLHCLFDGAEMVVAGRIIPDYDNNSNTVPLIDLIIEGNSGIVIDQSLNMTDTALEDIPTASAEDIKDFTHRLWVYLTIKQLITTTLQTTDPEKATEAKNKALELSLKYNFVTPYTSMVVTKPGEDDAENREVMGGKRTYEPEEEVFYDSVPLYSQYMPQPNRGPVYTPGGAGMQYASVSNPNVRFGGAGLPGLPGKASNPYGGFGKMAKPSYNLRPMSKPQFPVVARRQPATTTTPNYQHMFHFTTAARRPTRTTTTTAPRASHATTTKAPMRPKVSGYPPALNVALSLRQTTGKQTTQSDANICLDIPFTANKGSYTLLQTADINISAKTSRRYPDGKKFEKISFKTANTTVEFSTRSIRIDGKPLAWWQLKQVNISQGEVTSDGGVRLDCVEGVTVTVTKHGIESRRSRAKPFLIISISAASLNAQKPGGLVGRILKLKKPELDGHELIYRNKGRQTVPIYVYSLSGGDTCYRLAEPTTVAQILKL